MIYRRPLTKISDIKINEWYNVQYPDKPNLCRVQSCYIHDNKTGANVRNYKVVCFYLCNDVFIGSLHDCKDWILTHLIGR